MSEKHFDESEYLRSGDPLLNRLNEVVQLVHPNYTEYLLSGPDLRLTDRQLVLTSLFGLYALPNTTVIPYFGTTRDFDQNKFLRRITQTQIPKWLENDSDNQEVLASTLQNTSESQMPYVVFARGETTDTHEEVIYLYTGAGLSAGTGLGVVSNFAEIQLNKEN